MKTKVIFELDRDFKDRRYIIIPHRPIIDLNEYLSKKLKAKVSILEYYHAADYNGVLNIDDEIYFYNKKIALMI